MTKKLPIWLVTTFILANPCGEAAAQRAKVPRIGYISGTGDATNQGPYVEALRQGLRDLGQVEGTNFSIEYRGAEGKRDRIPVLVNELVELKVDILILPVLPAILAAKQATKTIPIVMVSNADPVATGLIDTLARPGGNITGLSTLSKELSGKRLALLSEVVPRLSRVGILRDDSQSTSLEFKEYEAAAISLKIKLQPLDVRNPNPDLEGAVKAAVKGLAGALIAITSTSLFLRRERITELAIMNRLPSLFSGSTWVEAGGLMSYATDDLAVYRRAATYVHKILKGSKPADLPVEQPLKFEFAINLKTAKQIGLSIPQSILFRADKVIR